MACPVGGLGKFLMGLPHHIQGFLHLLEIEANSVYFVGVLVKALVGIGQSLLKVFERGYDILDLA